MRSFEDVEKERADRYAKAEKEASQYQAENSRAGSAGNTATPDEVYQGNSGTLAATDQVFHILEAREYTIKMFAALVHKKPVDAEQVLFRIMEGTLSATRSGQKNAAEVATMAQAALNIYQRWNN